VIGVGPCDPLTRRWSRPASPAAHRQRSPHSRGDRGVASGSLITARGDRRDGRSQGLNP
jgi:hypothetical protein